MHDDFSTLPIIDVAPLATGNADKQHVAAQIDAACHSDTRCHKFAAGSKPRGNRVCLL